MPALLRIRWVASTEFVPFDTTKRVAPRQTKEFWDDGTVSVYNVASRCTRLTNGSFDLRTYYRESANPQVKDDVAWGHSVLSFRPGAKQGRALWVDEGEDESAARASRWSVSSEDGLRKAEHESVERIRRNSLLRADLVRHGCVCALTDEIAEACDAAHVVAAAKGGYDNMNEAMLLRADLHRLFDNGFFNINSKGVVCDISPELSHYYQSLLRERISIRPDDFQRTRKALQLRAKQAR